MKKLILTFMLTTIAIVITIGVSVGYILSPEISLLWLIISLVFLLGASFIADITIQMEMQERQKMKTYKHLWNKLKELNDIEVSMKDGNKFTRTVKLSEYIMSLERNYRNNLKEKERK